MRYSFWRWDRKSQEYKLEGEANCPNDVPEQEQEEFNRLWRVMTRELPDAK